MLLEHVLIRLSYHFATGTLRNISGFSGVPETLFSMAQLQSDWFCAVVTERGNISITVKHDVKGDCVPGAIRKVALSINSIDERRRHSREGVGHQDSLSARD